MSNIREFRWGKIEIPTGGTKETEDILKKSAMPICRDYARRALTFFAGEDAIKTDQWTLTENENKQRFSISVIGPRRNKKTLDERRLRFHKMMRHAETDNRGRPSQ